MMLQYLSLLLFYTYLTPRSFNGNPLTLHLPEPDSYPNPETPISTRKAYYDKRSRTKKTEKKNEEEEWMKNADLIIFYNFLYYLFKKFTKNPKKNKNS